MPSKVVAVSSGVKEVCSAPSSAPSSSYATTVPLYSVPVSRSRPLVLVSDAEIRNASGSAAAPKVRVLENHVGVTHFQPSLEILPHVHRILPISRAAHNQIEYVQFILPNTCLEAVLIPAESAAQCWCGVSVCFATTIHEA